MNKTFDLVGNAFNVLKAEYDSTRSEIIELSDDAEFDEFFSTEEIQRAQQELFTPSSRLLQELSWLPELSAKQISDAASLISSNNFEELKDLSEHLPELAKANIFAYLCGNNRLSDLELHTLAVLWDEVNVTSISAVINYHRQNSGFPEITQDQLTAPLKEIEKLHATTVTANIWDRDEPGSFMESFVEAELARNQSSTFLELLVRSYDSLSENTLVNISDEIDNFIEQVKIKTTDLDETVSNIRRLLKNWDEINQPVQVYEQSQGHEEARSKQIYEKIRILCLDLANVQNKFFHARLLSEALLDTFPELESISEILKKDVAQLEALEDQHKHQYLIEELTEACSNAQAQIKKLQREIKLGGFSPASRGFTAEVFRSFQVALKTMSDKSISYLIVRDLALDLNNEHDDSETAFKIVNGLLLYDGPKPSEEIINKLTQEREVLHRNWKTKELEKKSGNLSATLEIIDDMLKYASGSERADLVHLRSKIEGKRRFKTAKWTVYALIAAAIGIMWIVEETSKPTPRSFVQPSPIQSTAPKSTATAFIEALPPIGSGMHLSRSQVRYCVYQGERLDAMRLLISSDYQIEKFNNLISDYNSRCAQYRYTSGVLSSIKREAESKASTLQADAKRIVATW